MENNEFVLIPLHLWEEGTLQLPSIGTDPGNGMLRIFKRKQRIDPSFIGKNLITPKKVSKDTDPSTQSERLEEYFLNDIRKDSKAKKIFSELFENKVIPFILNNKIVMDNIDTEAHERDFFHNLRPENGSLDPKHSIKLNTLNFPQSYMTNTVALTDDDKSWFSFFF